MSQRGWGFALLCLQAGAICYLADNLFVPFLAVGIAGYGLLADPRWQLSQRQFFWWLAGPAIVFIVRYLVAPPLLPADSLTVGTQLAHVFVEFLLFVQAQRFLLKRGLEALPRWYLGLAAITLACIADVRVNQSQRVGFQVITVVFLVLAGGYAGSVRQFVGPGSYTSRRLRTALLITVWFVVTGGGWLLAGLLHHYEREIDRWVASMLDPTSQSGETGFSPFATIGSIARHQQRSELQTAVRVFGEDPPGYLRGRVYDRYERGEWFVGSINRGVAPLSSPPEGIPTPEPPVRLFEARPVVAGSWQSWQIWPTAALSATCFSPLDATHLKMQASGVSVNRYEVFETDAALTGEPYTIYQPQSESAQRTDSAAADLQHDERLRLLAVPASLAPLLQVYADEVFVGCHTTQEKLDAVVRFFHDGFEYERFSGASGNATEPIARFLTERHGAHCEFFAAAASLLLRQEGVPCRYVTGFVAQEYNAYGEFWVARNRDAHAWVEAFDEERGWVIVEPTPPSGVPSAREIPGVMALWESYAAKFATYQLHLRQRGWLVIGDLVWNVLTSPWWLLALGSATLLLLGRRLISRVRRRLHSGVKSQTPLQKLLARMDLRLKPFDLQRRKAETLNRFADRLTSHSNSSSWLLDVADWYRRAAAARYRPGAEPSEVQELAHALDRLISEKPVGTADFSETARNPQV